MAIVVTTARSSVSGVLEPVHVPVRRRSSVQALGTAAALSYALVLVAESAARAVPQWPWIDAGRPALTITAASLILATCAAAWLTRRDDGGLLLAATLAPVVAAVRSLTLPVLVGLDLSTLAEVASVGLGLLTVGTLTWFAALPLRGMAEVADSPQAEMFRRVAEITALVVFAVALSGAMVRAVGASWACGDAFPGCNGLGALPFGREPLADVQLYHRLLAYVALGLAAWLSVEVFRTQRAVAGLVPGALVLFGLILADAAIGALYVSVGTPPLLDVTHTAATLATWSAAIGLVVLSHGHAASLSATRTRVPWLAYIQLTKPRVMSLLLATTAAAMVIAARGMPDLTTLIATLLGGALMSGGAGAINHYVDRDIDPLMGRTAWRPIPSGVISPHSALRFGIGLSIVATAVFLLFVNPLAAVLAIVGLLGYVFIYTLWLKRSTPSNIVIGGAAGAIPPLVGWAAVTNEIGSLTAWYLFAIIFFWTPPHFWALSLLIRKHYERAGIPMLPVVRGEDETRRQIVLYALLMVVLTLVLSPFGMMGKIYFAAAAVLGALFIRNALQLWRRPSPQAARRLYLYSILYLFALFAAMAVDRVVAL